MLSKHMAIVYKASKWICYFLIYCNIIVLKNMKISS